MRDPGTQPAYSALRSCAWFAGWPATALGSLSFVSSLRSFGTGQAVTQDRDGLNAIMVVIKGRLRSIHRGEGGREITLETFRAGEVCVDGVSEAAKDFSTDIIAAETSLILFIPRNEFFASLRTVPEAALTMVKDFERRLVRSKAMVAGLALSDVQARLHQTLVSLARDDGEVGPEGVVIRRSPTQQ
jgi:CRP-like cAMP-binding protein